MNEQTINLLKDIAAKIGTTVDKLWDVLVRQATIYAISNTIILLFIVVVGIFLWRKWTTLDKEWGAKTIEYQENGHTYERIRSSSWDDHPGWSVALVGGGAVDLIAFVVWLSSFPTYVASIFNPKFWALQRLLELAVTQIHT